MTKEKIKWEMDGAPEPGQRILLRLSDGRVCAGKVTETLGFELERVDGLDLLANYGASNGWYPLEEDEQR